MFTGFSQETQDFLWGLLFHNERPWFEAHRSEYERYLLTPFRELALDTADEMRRRRPELPLNLHIARIYRDARRLFGRGPYKEHLWFALEAPGSHNAGPSFWFEIGAAQYGYGVGLSCASPDRMEAYRRAIAANPAGFLRAAAGLEAEGGFVLEGEVYKRPKGDLGPELNRWYNRKEIAVTRSEDFGGALFTPELPAALADGFDRLVPLYAFLTLACGPDAVDTLSGS